MKVLLAAESSIYSRAALDSLLACPWPDDTEFLVLSVAETYHPRTDYWNPLSQELLRDQEAKMLTDNRQLANSFAQLLREKFPACSVQPKVVEGHVVDTILHEADDWGAELIVLGSHGLKGFTKFMLGSVSESVSSHSKVSVRIVRLRPGK